MLGIVLIGLILIFVKMDFRKPVAAAVGGHITESQEVDEDDEF